MSGSFNKIFSSWINVTSDFRNELVFADRNKAYGAFQLRKNYNRAYSLALLITVVAFVLGFGIPKLISVLTEAPKVVSNVDVQVDLDPPPIDEDEPEPPPPPPPPPPPVEEMIKFVPPIVVDEIIEDPPPDQTKLDSVKVGLQTQAGSDVDTILPNLDPPGGGPVDPPPPPVVFAAVQEMPEFIGGEAAMMKYIYENINYPEAAKVNTEEGKIRLKFTVTADGSIKDVHVVGKDRLKFGCEEEAIRVIYSMPKWKPGRQNGNPVAVYFNLPVTFKLY